MPLILAVEPDRRQASRIAAVLRTRPRTELVIAQSAATALGTLADRVPDVLLTSPLLSRQDEAAIAAWLRGLGPAAARVQALTIPILATSAPAPAPKLGVLSVLRRRGRTTTPEGCAPTMFADQVGLYLERASAERDEIEATQASPTPPPPYAPLPPADVSPELWDDQSEMASAPEAAVIEAAALEAAAREAAAREAAAREAAAREAAACEAAAREAAARETAAREAAAIEAAAIEAAAIEAAAIEAAAREAAALETAALKAAAIEAAALKAAARAVAAREAAAREAAALETAALKAAALEAAALEAAAREVAAREAAALKAAQSAALPAEETVDFFSQIVVPVEAIAERVDRIEAPVAETAAPVAEIAASAGHEMFAAIAQDRPDLASRLRGAMSTWGWRREPLPVDTIAAAVAPLEPAAIQAPAAEAPLMQVVIEEIPERRTAITAPDTERMWVPVPLEGIVDTAIAAAKPAEVPRAEDSVWVLTPTQIPELFERFAAPPRPAVPTAWAPTMLAAPEPVPAPQPAARKRTEHSRPKPKPKPVQDEWGFFDPQQCGFAALLAKLDEITEESDVDHGRAETTVQIIGY